MCNESNLHYMISDFQPGLKQFHIDYLVQKDALKVLALSDKQQTKVLIA